MNISLKTFAHRSMSQSLSEIDRFDYQAESSYAYGETRYAHRFSSPKKPHINIVLIEAQRFPKTILIINEMNYNCQVDEREAML